MKTLMVLIKLWLCGVCWVWGAANATPVPPAQTQPIHYATSAWLDLSGTAMVENVAKQAIWEPFTGWKSWGFGPEPVWLRISVPAARSAIEPPQALLVRQSFLDHLTLHDPATGTVQRAGDFWPARQDAMEIGLYTFTVPAHPQARDLLLKLESSSARVVHLSLLPWSQAQSVMRSTEWLTGGALILSLIFSVWSLVQWWFTREPLMRAFAVKQLLVSVWGFLQLGFARAITGDLFAPGVLSLFNGMTSALMMSAIMWFFGHLLAEYSPRAGMLRTLQASRWLPLALMGLNFVEPRHLALQSLNSAVPLLLLLILLTLWTAKPNQKKPSISRGLMLGYMCFYSLMNATSILGFLNLVPESSLLFFGHMSSLLANGVVMFIILLVRERRVNMQNQVMATQLLLQKQQAQLDQQYMEEQRQLLAMLAHEMKTPLANLRIWMEAGPQGRPVMERAIHDMNRVIERCVQTGQLSDQRLQPHNEWLDAAALTQAVLIASRQPERVTLQCPPDACALYADAQMLSIVLSNMLENAYKYSAPETPIDLRLTPQTSAQGTPGLCWQIDNTVGDAGLPEGDKVFNKYYRSPHAKRQSGSGLGLFLVKSLLTLMHGQVTYTALPDRVRFEVWLPCEPATRNSED